jgi:hypothetical protein
LRLPVASLAGGVLETIHQGAGESEVLQWFDVLCQLLRKNVHWFSLELAMDVYPMRSVFGQIARKSALFPIKRTSEAVVPLSAMRAVPHPETDSAERALMLPRFPSPASLVFPWLTETNPGVAGLIMATEAMELRAAGAQSLNEAKSINTPRGTDCPSGD